MAHLRFGVLGTLTVAVDGRDLPVPSGRQRAVLSCLLVHAGHPVSADALVEAAWGEDLPRHPQAALHTVLSRLRAMLGTEVVVAGPAGYRLEVTHAAVDAHEFEQLVDRAGSAEPAAARVLLARALDLWRGPAYAELADTPFARAESARLESLRMDAVEAQASACIECGAPASGAALLDGLLAEQPYRERAVELLMAALYHSGRQAEALERYHKYRTVLLEELGLDPSPALTGLERRILGHGLPPAGADLPPPPSWLDTSTAFVGREDELTRLVSAVADNRVTVVTGPGGVGKTRLAAQALPRLQERLGLPVAVVELVSVAPGGAAAAVSDALGMWLDDAAVTDGLTEYLGAVPHLLVLDNCEHLLAEVLAVAAAIARRCPRSRVLATSRRRLGLTTELVLPLLPLAVPDARATGSGQQATAAMRLVSDRVRRLQPALILSDADADVVAELCRRLDGLPLALELAASRIATSGVGEILDGVPAELLRDDTGRPHSPAAWSYRLLGEDEQALLATLSVLAGDFTLDAVRGLSAHLPSRRPDVSAALAELVESSLVSCRVEPGRTRYRLLAVVRTFAAARLAQSGDEEPTRLAHARWVKDVATELAADWALADGADVAGRLADSVPETTAALRWALGAGRVVLASDIAAAIARCLHWTPGVELRDLMVRLTEQAALAPDPGVAAGMGAGALHLTERGDLPRAREVALTALDVAEVPDDADLPLLALGVAAMYSGAHEEAARWFQRLATVPGYAGEAHSSLALLACYGDDLPSAREHTAISLAAGAVGSDASLAFARYAAGEVEARTDPARGAALLEEAARDADRVAAEQVSRVARVALFALYVRTGRHDAAVALGGRLLRHLRRRAAWAQVWTTLRMLAELLADTGRPADAAFFLEAARTARAAPPPIGLDVERYGILTEELGARLGVGVLRRIREVAAGTSRARVLTRAEGVISTIAAPER